MKDMLKFSVVHGLVKGFIRSTISTVHSRIDKDIMISKPEDVNNMPELVNVLEAYEEAMKMFEKYNCPGSWNDKNNSYVMLTKGKDIMATAVGSDTAYYLMMEYFLKAYCKIKFKGRISEEQIEEMFDAQWEEKMIQLMEKNKNGTV